MHNLLGLSDESWGFLIAALGLLCSIPLGLAVQKRWLRLGAAAAIAGVCAVIGPVFIGGGGPAAGVGLVF